MTLTTRGLCLEETNGERNKNNRWICKDHGIYIGFYNAAAKVFIGHNDKGGMIAKAPKLLAWEDMIYRQDRKGGYQMLSMHWAVHKNFVNAVEDMTKVAREDNLHTLWEFEEVFGET